MHCDISTHSTSNWISSYSFDRSGLLWGRNRTPELWLSLCLALKGGLPGKLGTVPEDPVSSSNSASVVAVAVLADPSCSGAEEFQGSPGQAHAALTVSAVKSRISRSLRCSSSRPS